MIDPTDSGIALELAGGGGHGSTGSSSPVLERWWTRLDRARVLRITKTLRALVVLAGEARFEESLLDSFTKLRRTVCTRDQIAMNDLALRVAIRFPRHASTARGLRRDQSAVRPDAIRHSGIRPARAQSWVADAGTASSHASPDQCRGGRVAS